jgi:hypothetical protein
MKFEIHYFSVRKKPPNVTHTGKRDIVGQSTLVIPFKFERIFGFFQRLRESVHESYHVRQSSKHSPGEAAITEVP